MNGAISTHIDRTAEREAPRTRSGCGLVAWLLRRAYGDSSPVTEEVRCCCSGIDNQFLQDPAVRADASAHPRSGRADAGDQGSDRQVGPHGLHPGIDLRKAGRSRAGWRRVRSRGFAQSLAGPGKNRRAAGKSRSRADAGGDGSPGTRAENPRARGRSRTRTAGSARSAR